MVTVTGYHLRKNAEGKEFFILILQSGVEMIKSKNGFYATAKKVSVPSTFNEEACRSLIGHKMKGSIKSVKCDPYTFLIPETGEEIIMENRFEYFPHEDVLEELGDLEKSSNNQMNGQLT